MQSIRSHLHQAQQIVNTASQLASEELPGKLASTVDLVIEADSREKFCEILSDLRLPREDEGMRCALRHELAKQARALRRRLVNRDRETRGRKR